MTGECRVRRANSCMLSQLLGRALILARLASLSLHGVSLRPHSSVELVYELNNYGRVYGRYQNCVERRTVTCQSSIEAVLQLAVEVESEDHSALFESSSGQ